MYPASFEYHRPQSVDEAVQLLGQLGPDETKLLAGGHSLLPLMKLRFAQPKHVIDLGRVAELSGIREEGGALVLGALTTHREMEASGLVRARVPMLGEAAAQIGDPLVRNRGTLGGSLAHADPNADYPAVMLALGAEMRVAGPRGARTIPADDFFVGLLTTALQPDEVLTTVRVPVPRSTAGGAYEKYPHPASRFAVVGVAALLTVEGGKVSSARVAITGLGAIASRARGVEQALTGRGTDEASLDAAAARVAEGIDVRADNTGPEAFKRNLAVVYCRKALARAAGRVRRA